jgi:hypothetical protein
LARAYWIILFVSFGVLYPLNDTIESAVGIGITPIVQLAMCPLFFVQRLTYPKAALVLLIILLILFSSEIYISLRYAISLFISLSIAFVDLQGVDRRLMKFIFAISLLVWLCAALLLIMDLPFQLFNSRNDFVFHTLGLLVWSDLLFFRRKNLGLGMIFSSVLLLSRGRSGFIISFVRTISKLRWLLLILPLVFFISWSELGLDRLFERIFKAKDELVLGYGSGGIRIQLYSAGLILFLENPIFGIGLGVFTMLSENLIVNPVHEINNIQPHSSWIGLLAEAGLCGLFLIFNALRRVENTKYFLSLWPLILFMFFFDALNRPHLWLMISYAHYLSQISKENC